MGIVSNVLKALFIYPKDRCRAQNSLWNRPLVQLFCNRKMLGALTFRNLLHKKIRLAIRKLGHFLFQGFILSVQQRGLLNLIFIGYFNNHLLGLFMAWNPLRLIPSFEIELHHNLWALGDAQNVKSKNYNTFKKYSKIFNFKILSHLTPFIYSVN